MNLREQLTQGQASLARVGEVRPGTTADLPYVITDDRGEPVEAVSAFLRDLMLGDCRPATCRSYAHDLLRWLRLLATVGVGWEQAARGEVALLVAWMRKPYPAAGYARTTINHALTVVRGFYAFHLHAGAGPLCNPVPEGPQRRVLLAHRSPVEPVPPVRRSPLRQKVPARQPRSIPDGMWAELLAAMGRRRDRALLACYVSSGARASELLALRAGDIDWQEMVLWVPCKGSDVLTAVPISPEAVVLLAAYLTEAGPPPPGTPVWRASRGQSRPLTYWAMRRVLQRANAVLGTNWSLHDIRHTTCARMSADPALTLPEVQAVMRHARLSTTQQYMTPRLEELIGKLQAHYQRPAPPPVPAPGYASDDLAAVFGG